MGLTFDPERLKQYPDYQNVTFIESPLDIWGLPLHAEMPYLRGSDPVSNRTNLELPSNLALAKKTVVHKGSSTQLSYKDRLALIQAPGFDGRKMGYYETSDVESGKQKMFSSVMFNNGFLTQLWQGAVGAYSNAGSGADSTNLPYDTALPTEANIGDHNPGGLKKRELKMVIYRRTWKDTFTNQCNMALTFTYYYCGTRRPQVRDIPAGTWRPYGLNTLLEKMQADSTGGVDEMVTNPGGWGRRHIQSIGMDPTQVTVFKQYYRRRKVLRFTLHPGQSIEIYNVCRGSKLFNGYTYAEYAEYPGIAMPNVYTVVGQICGDRTTNLVSTSSGEFSHVIEERAFCKVLDRHRNFKGDHQSVLLPSILDSNQQVIDQETGQRVLYTEEEV